MNIEESRNETEMLSCLCNDENPKIALLAQYIKKIVLAADLEETYRMEQNERR